MASESALTELQLRLLTVLWRIGEGTIVDVHEGLGPRDRVSQATVATLLARLAGRGVLARRRAGRAYVYRPRLSESQVRRQVTSEFLDRTQPLFQGNLAQMVAHLLASDTADASDLREAERLLAEAKRRAGKGGAQE